MSDKESKRVFLSHKGVDKSQVKNYKDTLELIGFSPWIDEDAMPAGTPLERGIAKGMQDSCGVVFFITPSFRDEGYLQTEIDYAVMEKRKKGERFTIIALQFEDKDGRKGDVPNLLKSYVWKNPKTELEALREILRALPIETKNIDWRENIVGVVTKPNLKTAISEMTFEAKTILLEAVSGNGVIAHIRTRGGVQIEANGKKLIQSNQSRDVALWVGGLEDLIQKGFVKDRGSRKEVFEVTREGYEMADHLKQASSDGSG